MGVFILSTSLFAQALKPIKQSNSNKEKIDLSDIKLNFTKSNSEYQFDSEIEYQANSKFTGNEHIHGMAKIWQFDKTNQPSFIEQKEKIEFRSLDQNVRLVKYFEQLSPMLNIEKQDIELVLVSDWVDNIGNKHYKLNQQLNGKNIYGAEIILHDEAEILSFFNGKYHTSKTLKNATSIKNITIDKATDIVLATCSKHFIDLEEQNFPLPKNFKQVNKEEVYYMHEDGLRLAYYFNVHPNFGEWYTYFIDANDGSILKKYSNICSLHATVNVDENEHSCHHHKTSTNNSLINKRSKNASSMLPPPNGPATAQATDLMGNNVTINSYGVGNAFYLIDASRNMFDSSSSSFPNNPAGTVWTLDGKNNSPIGGDFDFEHLTSSNNSWSEEVAVSAHNNGGLAYEYFRTTHGRSSIDGQAGNIPSFVNVADADGSSLGNAFWSSIAIFYGNGDSSFKEIARALDVSGHEMSHGVVQNTANLEYLGESGAINESFADAFGAMLDREDWLIGEDCVRTSAYPSGALRDMSDPHNGQSTNQYNSGWQPSHVNEMYIGEQDNGGVHANSGIPNHAFYLIATDIGKNKTEKIYYHALSNYLTKSSQFTDLRVAILKSADDLYGSSEMQAVNEAFDAVGIAAGSGGNYQQNASENPGSDLIMFTNSDFEGIYLITPDGTFLANPLSSNKLRSRPSASDDGSRIAFIGIDNKMYGIEIDWSAGTFEQVVISDEAIWRNVVISKDGNRLAALTDEIENEIFVYDYGLADGKTFELFNPTYTEGITTGDVLFADVLEFDLTSNYILYDAANEISSNTAESITYWDMGLIKVWDKDVNNFDDGKIIKIFPTLSTDISIGNPTFSKNSPFIIAFDLISEDRRQVIGANLETGDTGLIYENTVLGYPSYSKSDEQIIFNLPASGSQRELGLLNVNDDKISVSTPPSDPSFFSSFVSSRWGVWFSNGTRTLSKLENLEADDSHFSIYPNPTQEVLHLDVAYGIKPKKIEIYDLHGNLIQQIEGSSLGDMQQIDTSEFSSGMYILSVYTSDKKLSKSFVKING